MKYSAKLNFRCIVAGLNPTQRVIETVSAYQNIQLIANPAENKMNELVQNAHINILVTFQGTGLKIKLLNTLFFRQTHHCKSTNARRKRTRSTLPHCQQQCRTNSIVRKTYGHSIQSDGHSGKTKTINSSIPGRLSGKKNNGAVSLTLFNVIMSAKKFSF